MANSYPMRSVLLCMAIAWHGAPGSAPCSAAHEPGACEGSMRSAPQPQDRAQGANAGKRGAGAASGPPLPSARVVYEGIPKPLRTPSAPPLPRESQNVKADLPTLSAIGVSGLFTRYG